MAIDTGVNSIHPDINPVTTDPEKLDLDSSFYKNGMRKKRLFW